LLSLQTLGVCVQMFALHESIVHGFPSSQFVRSAQQSGPSRQTVSVTLPARVTTVTPAGAWVTGTLPLRVIVKTVGPPSPHPPTQSATPPSNLTPWSSVVLQVACCPLGTAFTKRFGHARPSAQWLRFA
jgi:hypothetical protein